MNQPTSPFLPVAAWLLCGCAAGTGVITKTRGGQIAEFSVNPGAVQEGDTVAVTDVRCSGRHKPQGRRRPPSISCHKVVRGTGKVTATTTDGRAMARFAPSFDFSEGDVVEPLRQPIKWKRSEP